MKHLMLLKIRNMMDIHVDLLQWFINCLIKTRANKFAGSDIKNENIPDQRSAEELHKLIIRKFEKRQYLGC